MKKILSALVIICLLMNLTAFSVAADKENIAVTSVSYASDGNLFKLVIKGFASERVYVSLTVKNEIGTVRAMEQCTTGESGFFTKEVMVETSDDLALRKDDGALLYMVYVRDYYNNPAAEQIFLYSEEMKQKIIDENFKTADDTDKMKAAIEKYGKIFGFNTAYYIAKASETAEFMIDRRQNLTTDTIADVFDESVIRAYLFDADLNSNRTKILEDEDLSKITDFTTGFGSASSLYPEYKAMTSEQKKGVNSIAFNKNNRNIEFMKLKEKLFMAIVSQIFTDNKDDYTAIYNFLKKHNDWLELNGLEKLTKYKASQIIGLLSEKEIPDTQADFAALYDRCADETNGDVKPVTPAPTGGKGSGGGGQIGSGVKLPITESTPPVSNESKYFTDLDGYEWADTAIKALFDKKIISGRSDDVFAPGDNITREEFAKILTLAYGLYDEKAECGFSDVSEADWSYRYIASIYKNGIANGYTDGSFGARKNISREEMAVMIYRVLIRQSKIKSPENVKSSFKDFDKISDFAVNSVLALKNDGIISGDNDNNFNPQSNATRAETCVMIYNAALAKGES